MTRNADFGVVKHAGHEHQGNSIDPGLRSPRYSCDDIADPYFKKALHMNDHESYELLNGVFKDVFARDDIVLTSATVARDIVGWDSFKHVEIVLALEDRLGIEISTTEATDLRSVDDLVKLLQRKLRELGPATS